MAAGRHLHITGSASLWLYLQHQRRSRAMRNKSMGQSTKGMSKLFGPWRIYIPEKIAEH